MLKPRLIGLIPILGPIAVQSIGFTQYLPIGRPEIAVKYLDRWGVDEIAIFLIDRAGTRSTVPVEDVRRYAKQAQVPLAIGGGIGHLDDVKRLIAAGADKVSLNTAIVANPGLIDEAARHFGSQCVVACVDARTDPTGNSLAFIRGGRESSGMTAVQFAVRAQELGAGEILLQSIDRDGTKRGYDLGLIAGVMRAVSVPVIACGGAGHPAHLDAALAVGVSAVAVGNMLHYTEHSVPTMKRQLAQVNRQMRLEGPVIYDGVNFDKSGRLMMRSEEYLERLRFTYIPEEKV